MGKMISMLFGAFLSGIPRLHQTGSIGVLFLILVFLILVWEDQVNMTGPDNSVKN